MGCGVGLIVECKAKEREVLAYPAAQAGVVLANSGSEDNEVHTGHLSYVGANYLDDFVGEALVVYEYLSWDDLQIAVHTNIADEEQTVRIPKIGTTATDSQTEDHITLAAENAKIIDTVFYQNVTRNEAFILVGTLMNKGTGEPVKDEDVCGRCTCRQPCRSER